MAAVLVTLERFITFKSLITLYLYGNVVAIVNGLITSIILETIILMRTFIFAEAISIAFKMSFISMISMEIAMNATDLIFAGGVLTITIIPFMLLAGFYYSSSI